MYEGLKFLEIRKFKHFAVKLDGLEEFRRQAFEEIFEKICGHDRRLKSMSDLFVELTQIAAVLSLGKNTSEFDFDKASNICKNLFVFVVSLSLRKREAGSEKSKSVYKSQQHRAFLKIKKDIQLWRKTLEKIGDPLIPTQQMLLASSKFVSKMEEMFEGVHQIQQVQSDYGKLLVELGDLVDFETAEALLLSIFDVLGNWKHELSDFQGDKTITFAEQQWLPVRRKTIENQFRVASTATI